MAITKLTSSALPGQRVSSVPAVTGSYTSLLAPWIGGASAPSDASGGYRSLSAFWIGGASEATSTTTGGGPDTGGRKRYESRYTLPDSVTKNFWAEKIKKEDEEIVLIIEAILRCY